MAIADKNSIKQKIEVINKEIKGLLYFIDMTDDYEAIMRRIESCQAKIKQVLEDK
jgi:hypothetical protein